MDKKHYIKEVVEYTFDEEEAKLLKTLLGYCWHRATKHATPMSKYSGEIDKLRKQLK